MKKKWLSIFLAISVVSMLFTGCTMGGKKVYFSSGTGLFSVFRIGDQSCPKNEALTYLVNYRNIYGTIDGTDLFEGNYNQEQMLSNLKNGVLSHLTLVYAMNQYAKENEIELDQQEKVRVEQAAEKYFASLTEEEVKALDVKESDIQEMYEHLALAEKMYTSLMGAVDEEVSEDEARVVDAQILETKDKETADLIQSALESGTDFALLNSYSEGETLEVSLKRGDVEEVLEEKLFSLQNGEIAGPIQTEDGTYYFVRVISKYNEELSEENKKVIVQKRQTNRVGDILEDLDQNVYSEINQKLWDSLSLPTSEEVTTDSFFRVLHEYLSY